MDFRKVFAALAVAVASTSWNAAAAMGGLGPGHGPRDPFLGLPPDRASVDTNGDGTVSPEEIKTARTAQFKAADADGDGALTLAELTAWMSQRVEARFKALDTDSNGQVSLTEFVGSKAGRRATLLSNLLKLGDSDGNGSLSLDEFRTLAAVANKAGFALAAMDENGDGKVSEAEYLALPPWHRGHPGKAQPSERDAEADDT